MLKNKLLRMAIKGTVCNFGIIPFILLTNSKTQTSII